jgi:hypothetical protein
MTRYQAAVATLSTWLAKARAPRGDGNTRGRGERAPVSFPSSQATHSSTRPTRKLTLPPSVQRHDVSFRHPLVQLWRTVAGEGRHGVDPHE